MELQVGRWGNSLALRLPAELARQLHITEGALLDVSVEPTGVATLKPARTKFDKAAYMREVRALTEGKPITPSVIREMRDGARY
ncbi:MAG: mazE [Ramlibacter sp.]|jgi:antitoxin MazE|nr:mazE [Ramlibacter sp.]